MKLGRKIPKIVHRENFFQFKEGMTIKGMKTELIVSALEHFDGHVGRAAESIGLSRKAFYMHLNQLVEEYRKESDGGNLRTDLADGHIRV